MPDGSVVPFPNVTSVNEQQIAGSFFTAGPNPASNYLNIRFNEPLKNNGTLSLVNITGQVVSSTVPEKNSHQLNMDISKLITGFCFLKVSDGETSSITMFIKD